MPRTEKTEKVKEIKERLQAAEAALFADFRGLTVQDIGEVRGALVEAESQLAVVKNTLARLAVRDAGLEGLEAFLEGPTAIAFVKGDPVVGAKAIVDAAKRFPVLEVKGGLAEGRVLTAQQIGDLASLDSREEMLARLAGLFGIHMSRAAFVFQALQVKFLRLLDAYKEKLPGGEAERAAPSEEAATEAPVTDDVPPTEEGEAPSAQDEPADQNQNSDGTDDEQNEQEEGA